MGDLRATFDGGDAAALSHISKDERATVEEFKRKLSLASPRHIKTVRPREIGRDIEHIGWDRVARGLYPADRKTHGFATGARTYTPCLVRLITVRFGFLSGNDALPIEYCDRSVATSMLFT